MSLVSLGKVCKAEVSIMYVIFFTFFQNTTSLLWSNAALFHKIEAVFLKNLMLRSNTVWKSLYVVMYFFTSRSTTSLFPCVTGAECDKAKCTYLKYSFCLLYIASILNASTTV